MSEYFVDRDECGQHEVFKGVRVFTASCAQMMLSYVELEAHAVVEPHSHPHEQVGILLEGQLRFRIGHEERTLKPGDMWRIPGGVEHSAVAGNEPARALDIFHPVRDEYR